MEMASNPAGAVGKELLSDETRPAANNAPSEIHAIKNQSVGAATSATAAKFESSSIGEPWTLAGDSEHSRTVGEPDEGKDMSQYFIPPDPSVNETAKPPVAPIRETPGRRFVEPKAVKATLARRESNGSAASGDESVGSKEDGNTEIIIRPDGKKVRKVKRRSFDSCSIDESQSVGSTSLGEIYIRSDGKKVRRVKKTKPKSTATTLSGEITGLSQQPMAPLEEVEEFVKESTMEPEVVKPLSFLAPEVAPSTPPVNPIGILQNTENTLVVASTPLTQTFTTNTNGAAAELISIRDDKLAFSSVAQTRASAAAELLSIRDDKVAFPPPTQTIATDTNGAAAELISIRDDKLAFSLVAQTRAIDANGAAAELLSIRDDKLAIPPPTQTIATDTNGAAAELISIRDDKLAFSPLAQTRAIDSNGAAAELLSIRDDKLAFPPPTTQTITTDTNGAAAELISIREDKLQPINEINPWTMDPLLNFSEEGSHLSIEARNPFDTSLSTQDVKEPAIGAANPFDEIMLDPPQTLVPQQAPLSPSSHITDFARTEVSTLSPTFNPPDQGVSPLERSRHKAYDGPQSLPQLQTTNNPQSYLSSDTAMDIHSVRPSDALVHSSQLEGQSSPYSVTNRKTSTRQPLAESIMVRTRSRAEPNAVVVSPRNGRAPLSIRVSADDDAFILNTALARKRIRVVQLLIIGLLGFLFGFLGNVFIQSSCHFATAKVEVGGNGQVFRLHYGLWKFTPLDSVFQGYTYCYNYHDRFTGDAPLVSRTAGLAAMLAGGYSICVVWYYLIVGDAEEFYWRWSIRTAVAAGILQLLTMFFFIDDVCRSNTCALGPAGIVSLTSAVTWLILGFELWYNMPISAWGPDISDLMSSPDNSLMGTLEMSDFEDGAKAYFRRMRPNHDLPTLNQIQRENENPMGEAMRELSQSPRGTYIPPIVDL